MKKRELLSMIETLTDDLVALVNKVGDLCCKVEQLERECRQAAEHADRALKQTCQTTALTNVLREVKNQIDNLGKVYQADALRGAILLGLQKEFETLSKAK